MTQLWWEEHPCLRTDSRRGLKHIGYWRPSEKQILQHNELKKVIRDYVDTDQWTASLNLPWPGDFIDTSWNGRQIVIAHLKAGMINLFYDGASKCRLCDKYNGSQDLTDGYWGWPEGYAHYVEVHGVKPPEEFINHVLRDCSNK